MDTTPEDPAATTRPCTPPATGLVVTPSTARPNACGATAAASAPSAAGPHPTSPGTSGATTNGCAFCRIIERGEYDDEYDGIVDFRPLHPVVPGHRLVVPKVHVADALEDPWVTGETMAYAANLAKTAGLAPCNIMTSVGREATQSVFHLHIHIVPRSAGDGLMLPWTEQQAREAVLAGE